MLKTNELLAIFIPQGGMENNFFNSFPGWGFGGSEGGVVP